MNDQISVKKVVADAEENFREGYFCSEAVLDSICKNFGYDDSVVKLATGLKGGLGCGCLCGAVNAGAMSIGMVFGRSERTPHDDPRSNQCAALSRELRTWFKESCGKNSTCCNVLIKEFKDGKPGQRDQCIKFTGMCAGKTAEIIIREKGLVNIDE